MKRKAYKYFIFVSICLCVGVVLFFNIGNEVQIEAPQQTPKSTAYYLVSEYEGKIAVFKNGGTIPIDIYDTYISSLPQHDRLLLEKGIHADNIQELQEIIEDYTS